MQGFRSLVDCRRAGLVAIAGFTTGCTIARFIIMDEASWRMELLLVLTGGVRQSISSLPDPLLQGLGLLPRSCDPIGDVVIAHAG